MNKVSFLLSLLTLFLYACVPYTEEVFTEINIDLNDPEFQRLYDFKNQRLNDSLVKYFNHPDPTYRYEAALAFGTIKDTSILEPLAFLLQDPIDEVRAAAAFAIGQIGTDRGSEMLIENFARFDTTGAFKRANRAILEAVGKCGDEGALKNLSTISTYRMEDTMLLEGQCRGLYQYALRGLTTPEGTQKMIQVVTDNTYPANVRLVASSYLSAARGIALDSFASALSRTFFRENDPNIRMSLAIALGKSQSPTSLSVLLNQLKLDQDYRVKCNILRSLGNFEYDDCRDAVIPFLGDDNLPVAKRAAQFFVDFGQGKDATYYWKLAKDTFPWPIQLEMYQAAQRHLPNFYANYRGAINNELIKRFKNTKNEFEQAQILDVLAEFGWNYKVIFEESQKVNTPIVQTAGLEGLAKISNKPDFVKFFGLGTRRAERDLAQMFKTAIRTADPGLVTSAANALQNTSRRYYNYLDSLKFVDTIMLKLQKPEHIEPLSSLVELKRRFSKEELPTKQYKLKAVDWDLLSALSIEPQALIRTTRGVITVRLFSKLAPTTVSYFITLARSDFYDNSYFHRVVPNFIVQGGDKRGDGYSMAKSLIASEYSPQHFDQAGIVGMASLGTDTESNQFFISHAPTPNLDGQYTLFGRVIDGMEVVNAIQIGDKIEEIRIIQ